MADNSDIQILKPLWTRRADGHWAIHALKGITLQPKPGYDADFFAFDSQMELLSTIPPANLSDLFSSFGPTDFLVKQSIMPVITWRDGDSAFRTIGTAFIVSCTGYIITASHVVLDPHEKGYGEVVAKNGNVETVSGVNIGVLMPLSPASGMKGFRILPIQEAWYWGNWRESPLLSQDRQFDGLIDITICKLPELGGGAAYQPLNLSIYPFSRGEKAYAIGYAEMQDIQVEYVEGQPHIASFDWELYVSIGEIIDVFPLNHENREVPTPGPCFDFRARIPGKMSGAPIFGAQGAIIRGVVSRSFSGEKHAYGCMMGPAMSLPFAGDRSLEKLMQNGNEGIAVVKGKGL